MAKRRFVHSYEELGALFGLHRASFPRIAREHKGAPRAEANGRHDVGKWEAFFKKHPEIKRHTAEGKDESRQELELEKMREQVRKLRLANDIEDGKYTPNAVLVERLTALASSQQALLRQKLESEYPTKATGKTAAEIRVLGKALVDDLCQRMQALVSAWT